MRSVWNGNIAFGLVSIPIKLYSAVSQRSIGFKLLCKGCMTPIRYERHCEGCDGPIDWNDTLKALDLGDGQYLPFTKEELDTIKPEKTDRIEIVEFVAVDEIAPIYYDKFYFCGPSRKTDRSYFLLKKVLEDSGQVAIGRFVMREREYVAAIQPYRSGLLLATLNYSYEIRDVDDIETLKEPPELKKQELELARKLVDQLQQDELNLEEFRDEFSERLQEMIDKKEKIVVEETGEEKAFDEESLMEALQASLN
jgi:DNA end-binding protein Ku